MADGWGPAAANSALDTFIATYPWVQLHIGPPGAAGAGNPAVETTRQQVVMANPAAGGIKASTATLDWTNVAGSEQYTHASAWSLAVGGVFGGSGAIVANPVTAGDNFSAPVAQVVAALPLAS